LQLNRRPSEPEFSLRFKMQKASPSWQDATEVRWRERSGRRTSSGLPKTPKWEKPLRRLVYDLTAVNDCILRFKYSSTAGEEIKES
jgi:hypothetical protein